MDPFLWPFRGGPNGQSDDTERGTGLKALTFDYEKEEKKGRFSSFFSGRKKRKEKSQVITFKDLSSPLGKEEKRDHSWMEEAYFVTLKNGPGTQNPRRLTLSFPAMLRMRRTHSSQMGERRI